MPMNCGRKMEWCSHCGRICNTSHDYPTNNTSCVDCGKILKEENLATKELIYTNRFSHATRHNKGRETIWCPHCARQVGVAHDHTTGIIHCTDCGKLLPEDKNTAYIRDATGGKHKRLKLGQSQTTKKRSSSEMNYHVLNKPSLEKPIQVKADDEYSKSDGHQWKSYDNEHESCTYGYDYNYDAGDESSNY